MKKVSKTDSCQKFYVKVLSTLNKMSEKCQHEKKKTDYRKKVSKILN